jgi:predicted  nucleic acid-binding Zn-ribbon protein
MELFGELETKVRLIIERNRHLEKNVCALEENIHELKLETQQLKETNQQLEEALMQLTEERKAARVSIDELLNSIAALEACQPEQ